MPLLLHDDVIGTFNVESMEPRAFSESDLQFLEIFSRDVAAALNTLELLVAEKVSTAVESVEAIHSAVALPVDEILNEAVNVMERYIGHEPEVVERLAADPAQRPGHQAGDPEGGPDDDAGAGASGGDAGRGAADPPRPAACWSSTPTRTSRIAAHDLLDRYGCVVETAHDGAEAIFMVRALTDAAYDVIIADIRLPDMNGYELMQQAPGDPGPGAADADDRFRLRSGPFDRQRPQGRSARLGHPVQAVPPGPAPQRRREDHRRAAAGAAAVKLTVAH